MNIEIEGVKYALDVEKAKSEGSLVYAGDHFVGEFYQHDNGSVYVLAQHHSNGGLYLLNVKTGDLWISGRTETKVRGKADHQEWKKIIGAYTLNSVFKKVASIAFDNICCSAKMLDSYFLHNNELYVLRYITKDLVGLVNLFTGREYGTISSKYVGGGHLTSIGWEMLIGKGSQFIEVNKAHLEVTVIY